MVIIMKSSEKEIDCPSCGGAWYQDLDECGIHYTCYACCNGTVACYEELQPVDTDQL